MKINREGGVYTTVYLCVLVILVGTALAFTSLGLKGRQQANVDNDKMRQILAAAHIAAAPGQTPAELFSDHVTAQSVYNSEGQLIGNDAFAVDMAKEAKLPGDKRQLPVFTCQTSDGVKYILPLSGSGLWGPIWGYVAMDADGSTIYGAYFAHEGETPGLGAEIAKSQFSDQFDGKHLFHDGCFLPVAVVKKGQEPLNGEDYVDGISGGTITSKGVGAMIDNCLTPYEAFLKQLQ